VTTRREERRAKPRRGRARSSAEQARESSGESSKDTQRIIPRGPSGESGRFKKIDDPDLRGAPIDAPPAEEIEASVGKGAKQRPIGQPAADSAALAPPQPGGDEPAPTVMKKPPPSDLEGRPPERQPIEGLGTSGRGPQTGT
jgi:hypothetical protein